MPSIADYLIDEEIASGGFGSVFRAINPDQMLVAIKIVEKDGGGVRDQAVESEAILQASLRHPNIVRLLAYFDTDRFHYVVMPLMEKGSVLSILQAKRGPLDEPTASLYFAQMGSGVGYLHANGYIHRDIKPANFVVNRSDRVRLTDFGTTTQLDDGEIIQGLVGSLLYMAPEVRAGDHYSHPADLWSLGMSLLEMAVFPFPQGTGFGPANENHELIPLASSAELRAVLESLLQMDPASRPTAASLLQLSWLNQ